MDDPANCLARCLGGASASKTYISCGDVKQGWKWEHFIHEKMLALSKIPKKMHVHRENDD